MRPVLARGLTFLGMHRGFPWGLTLSRSPLLGGAMFASGIVFPRAA